MADRVPPEESTPERYVVPNKADVAWEELQTLRAQARKLGIEVDDKWPIAELQAQIAAAS